MGRNSKLRMEHLKGEKRLYWLSIVKLWNRRANLIAIYTYWKNEQSGFFIIIFWGALLGFQNPLSYWETHLMHLFSLISLIKGLCSSKVNWWFSNPPLISWPWTPEMSFSLSIQIISTLQELAQVPLSPYKFCLLWILITFPVWMTKENI